MLFISCIALESQPFRLPGLSACLPKNLSLLFSPFLLPSHLHSPLEAPRRVFFFLDPATERQVLILLPFHLHTISNTLPLPLLPLEASLFTSDPSHRALAFSDTATGHQVLMLSIHSGTPSRRPFFSSAKHPSSTTSKVASEIQHRLSPSSLLCFRARFYHSPLFTPSLESSVLVIILPPPHEGQGT